MATTWYVRPDGGTRYSSNVPNGQCDGTADAAYPGSGTNQPCAFNDIRLLWQDGSFTYGDKAPGWGWVGTGGDTYLLRGGPWRIGWPNAKSCVDDRLKEAAARGICGNNAASGMPAPPPGTAAAHTRILGEHYADCHKQSARTALFGGFGLGGTLNLNGSKYLDLQCIDLSDHADGDAPDSAVHGLYLSNTTTHLSLQDIRIHGFRTFGIYGPVGDGFTAKYIDIVGNGGGGWSADANDGKTGTGRTLVQHYSILWNGCMEEYPIAHKLPYHLCRDQNSTGYGDGFGTATAVSKPGWQAHFDQGEVAYNTQDGLDALHLIGTGSSMTITRTLTYGNMGQQIKIGGAAGSAVNNLIVGNCKAMSAPIPGTPDDYNRMLSDFCRAGDQAVALTIGRGAYSRFENNTIYEAGNIAIDIECDGFAGDCDSTSKLVYQNNIFVGFSHNSANGYKGGDGVYPTAIYDNTKVHPFTNRGSIFSNNTTFHQRTNETCPIGRFDRNALCGSPKLTDETYHTYGYGDMTPLPGSPSVGSGLSLSDTQVDHRGAKRPDKPSRGALEPKGDSVADPAGTDGDHAIGGGADLPPVDPSQSFYVLEDDPGAKAEAPLEQAIVEDRNRLHALKKPLAICAVVVASGVGVLLLRKGRANATRS
jgi:hypothetical protein